VLVPYIYGLAALLDRIKLLAITVFQHDVA
jgi:hypothetical protein